MNWYSNGLEPTLLELKVKATKASMVYNRPELVHHHGVSQRCNDHCHVILADAVWDHRSQTWMPMSQVAPQAHTQLQEARAALTALRQENLVGYGD